METYPMNSEVRNVVIAQVVGLVGLNFVPSFLGYYQGSEHELQCCGFGGV